VAGFFGRRGFGLDIFWSNPVAAGVKPTVGCISPKLAFAIYYGVSSFATAHSMLIQHNWIILNNPLYLSRGY